MKEKRYGNKSYLEGTMVRVMDEGRGKAIKNYLDVKGRWFRVMEEWKKRYDNKYYLVKKGHGSCNSHKRLCVCECQWNL